MCYLCVIIYIKMRVFFVFCIIISLESYFIIISLYNNYLDPYVLINTTVITCLGEFFPIVELLCK